MSQFSDGTAGCVYTAIRPRPVTAVLCRLEGRKGEPFNGVQLQQKSVHFAQRPQAWWNSPQGEVKRENIFFLQLCLKSIFWKNPPPLQCCVFIGQGGTYSKRGQRTGGNIFSSSCARRSHSFEGIYKRRTNQGILDIQSFYLPPISPKGIDLFVVGEVASLVLCGRTPIHFVSERIIRREIQKKRPWNWTTGTENLACPQQHLLIRCNILTS